MTWLTVAALLIALVATQNRRMWRVVRHAVTLVHEMGHAIVGLITGGHVSGIILRKDSSGVTTTAHAVSGSGIQRLFTTLAGYPAPTFFGTAAIAAAASGYGRSGWWGLLLMGVLCLAFSRSIFTVISAFAFSLVPAVFLLWINNNSVSSFALLVLGGILVFGTINTLLDLTWLTSKKKDKGSDAFSLAEQTGISRWVWVAAMWALSAGFGIGAVLMVYALAAR